MSVPNPADFLPTHASILPGTHARTIDISATVDPARIPKLDPSNWLSRVPRPTLGEVITAFSDAVNSGCFPPGKPQKKVGSKHGAQPKGDILVEAWEISMPEIPAAAFDILFRMAAECASRYNGLLTLNLDERAAPDLQRLGRDELPPLIYPPPPFSVENSADSPSEDVTILVSFAEDVSKSTLNKTKTLIACWGKLVSWGGFPPGEGVPSSCGFVKDVSSHLDNEVVCTVEQLNASPLAWQPLIFGLSSIHTRAIIENVEIY